MVKIALLSAWHVHTRWFVKGLEDSGEGHICVVWDDDIERGQKMAAELGVPFVADLDEVLAMEEIEAVMVECATTKHTEVILKAAAAKKHIFCDKALALKSSDVQQIREAVEANGVKFMLSLESKIIGCYNYATDMVKSGKLGRITAVYFRRAHAAALTNMLPDYWFDTEQTGGGATLDLGCHGFYMLPQLCGKPKTVSCRMQELYGTGADESSSTIIEFENGCIGTAHTSFVSYKMDNLLEIIGTEGILVISGEPNNANFVVLLQCANVPGYEEKTAVPKSDIPEDDPLPIVQFARMVKSDKCSVPGYDMDVAATLTRIIECAYESAATGKTVEF